MAQIKRFTLAGAYSAGIDVFVKGAGYFRRGVLDIAAGDSAALAAVRAAAPNAAETGPFDDAVLPPPPPAGDPYPEYMRYNELIASIAGGTDEIAVQLNAAFVATEQVKLRKWYAALAKRNAAPAQILAVGDSITEGTGAAAITRRWQTLLQNSLRARLGVTSGATFPFIPADPATTSPGVPVTKAGTQFAATGYGHGQRTTQLADATSSLTFTFTGTRAKLLFVRGPNAVARVVVNGGTAVTVNMTGALADSGITWDSGALTRGAHTVVVTRDATSQAGANVYVEGMLTWDGDETAGIRVIDGGHHGFQTSQLLSGTNNYQNQGLALAASGGAGLVIVALGTNDAGSVVAPATFSANVATVIAGLRSTGFDGSVLYLTPYKGGGRADAVWDPYVAAIQGLADADADGVFLDLGSRMPDAPTASFTTSSLGLYSDTLHPSDAGHGYIADVLAGFLMPR